MQDARMEIMRMKILIRIHHHPFDVFPLHPFEWQQISGDAPEVTENFRQQKTKQIKQNNNTTTDNILRQEKQSL